MEIRRLNAREWGEAMDLCWRVFLQFEAPEYPAEGVEAFRAYLQDPAAVEALTVWGAWEGVRLTGVLAADGGHIALLFVDPARHRQGVGRALFRRLLRETAAKRLTVNASPYAVEVYRRLGFRETDAERLEDGIRYTPMEYRADS